MFCLKKRTIPEKLERAVRLYATGTPIKAIIAATGADPVELYRELRRRRMPLRGRPRAPRLLSIGGVPAAEIAEMHGRGMTLQAIADRLNCSRQRVHQVLKRMGALRGRPRATGRAKCAVRAALKRLWNRIL